MDLHSVGSGLLRGDSLVYEGIRLGHVGPSFSCLAGNDGLHICAELGAGDAPLQGQPSTLNHNGPRHQLHLDFDGNIDVHPLVVSWPERPDGSATFRCGDCVYVGYDERGFRDDSEVEAAIRVWCCVVAGRERLLFWFCRPECHRIFDRHLRLPDPVWRLWDGPGSSNEKAA